MSHIDEEWAEGADELRRWLAEQGFEVVAKKDRSRDAAGETCNWFARRRTALPAKPCEGSDSAPLLVVWPSVVDGDSFGDAEVRLGGIAGGRFHETRAFLDLPERFPGDVPERMLSIERALVREWNAIQR